MGAVMPTIENQTGLSWKHRTTKKQLLIWLGWLIGISIVVFAWQLISEKTVWFFVQDAPKQAADIGSRMVPPKWSYMSKLIKPVWDTINIATIGTIIAIIIKSKPIALNQLRPRRGYSLLINILDFSELKLF